MNGFLCHIQQLQIFVQYGLFLAHSVDFNYWCVHIDFFCYVVFVVVFFVNCHLCTYHIWMFGLQTTVTPDLRLFP